MSREFLQGKVGTGIRAAWPGEKTTTSFAIYVLVRNMNSTAYNYIHDTALANVGTQLDKTTNVLVGCKNITTDQSGNTTIADLANDPLVWADASGNALPSTQWTGLRIRRFEFTGLKPGTEYTVEPYTDAVNSTDPATGKLASFQFQVRTLSNDVFSGVHFACDNHKHRDASDNVGVELGGKEEWFDMAEIMASFGADITVSQDDMGYASEAAGNPIYSGVENWLDPTTVTGDTSPSSIIKLQAVDIRDSSLNVEEQSAAWDHEYALVAHFFHALLHPATLSLAMRSSIESTDSGDHLGCLNNCNFHISDGAYAPAFAVDYGCLDGSTGDWTNAKPSDSATVNWLQGGSGDASVTDPYNAGSACYANTQADLGVCGTMTLNHKLLMEYFFGRATGVQAESTTDWRTLYSDHPLGASGLGIDDYVGRAIWRKREHPLVDMFYLNTTYFSDAAGLRVAWLDDSSTGLPTNLAAILKMNTATNKTFGDAQRSWLQTQVAASTKDFIIIFVGDPLQQVDPLKQSTPIAFSEYGQPDSVGAKSTTELNTMMTALEATNKPILILTGDHHVCAMSNEQSNILQCVSLGTWINAGRREFSVTTSGFTGQYDAERMGFSRFVVTPERMYAYNIEISPGNPLGSDVAYIDAGDTQWQFTNRSSHQHRRTVVADGLAALQVI